MRRPRSGIGAELVPLVLILACLAGSLALIVTVHRRSTAPKTASPAVVLAVQQPPEKAPPAPTPVVQEEPEAPSPPAPEDPTPKAIARLTSAEAEQLLEASRADRRAEALEAARQAARGESERWRRRESLARLQLDSIDGKVRKIETEVDELALERDALEKERDARKAMASLSRSRPSQAILPHRGQNGTWRRPIIVECTNGSATIQPQGQNFGLLELSGGFGRGSNPFVAAVAQEAIRIQGDKSPDGQAVVPYIFFLVRPDGIRAYYEARGRLEPLGVTFGYELADQDWEVDFPDLDDLKTWDGSAPSRIDEMDPLARARPSSSTRPSGGSPAEDEEFPAWANAPRRGASEDGTGGEFTWPPKPRSLPGRTARAGVDAPSLPSRTTSSLRFSNSSGNLPDGPPASTDETPIPSGSSPRETAGPGSRLGGGPVDPTPSAAPRELALGVSPIRTLEPSGSSDELDAKGAAEVASGTSTAPGELPPSAKDDPANAFVWPSNPGGSGSKGRPSDRGSSAGGEGSGSLDGSPPVRHVGPFSRPLAMGLDSAASTNPNPGSPPSSEADPSQPDGPATGSLAPARGSNSKGQGSSGSPSSVRGIGQGGAPGVQPPAGTIGVGMPGMKPPTDATRAARSQSLPDLPQPSTVDRRFEVVLVCGPRGVIVQPGSYRVTADALKDRDGLLKKEIVALVKARRTANPRASIDPRVRFLVLPGGDATYWTARSQFLLSGLDWPMSTQVAEADHPTLLPSESW